MHIGRTLIIKELSLSLNKKNILKDINLELSEGEIFGLLGKNGAGKTTLIKSILGLARFNAGKIEVLGNDLTVDFNKCMKSIGAIVEGPDFYPYLSGWDNLKHFSRMNGSFDVEYLNHIIKIVGLSDSIKKRYKVYSLGMKQRLGIAQALLNKPKILILDEPTNGLDPAGIKEFRKYITELAEKEKLTIIISTHTLSEVQNLCTRVGILEEGNIIKIENVNSISKKTILLTVNDPIEIKEVMKKRFHSRINIEANTLSFDEDSKILNDVLKILIERKVEVTNIETKREGIEDYFFSNVGDDSV